MIKQLRKFKGPRIAEAFSEKNKAESCSAVYQDTVQSSNNQENKDNKTRKRKQTNETELKVEKASFLFTIWMSI